jgi:hypothetical protein
VQDASKTRGATDAKKEGSPILKFLNSGVVGVVVGFFLSWVFQRRERRQENNTRYRCLLESIANELDFYADKLTFLSKQISQFLDGSGVIPSYKFYPSFLEQGKLRMNEFMRNSGLVKDVGHCHFELSHICERMDLFRRECEATNPRAMVLTNGRGFKGLVDSNIPVFRATATALREEAETLRG